MLLMSPRRMHWGALMLALGLMAAGVVSCAVPQAPSGGPPDDTPPIVAEATPETGTTNFTGNAVELRFTRYLNQNSLAQALTISPPMDGRPEIRWSGRSVRIAFPEDLQPNTTYILTLDTDLRTYRNVNLPEPLVLAFATGDRINRGALSGQVVDARANAPAEAVDVFAYPAPEGVPPDTLPERPIYRTQTSPEGTFSFSFLQEQPYYVVAVDDRNRNRRPDPDEAFAVPPVPILYAAPQEDALPVPDTTLIEQAAIADEMQDAATDAGTDTVADPETAPGAADPPTVDADTTQAAMPPTDGARPPETRPAILDTLRLTPTIPGDSLAIDALEPDTLDTDTPWPSSGALPWQLTSIDTIPPTIQRAQARAATRLQVRFTESVVLNDRAPDAWVLAAVNDGSPFAVRDVWMHPESDREVHLATEPLLPGRYVVTAAGVTDRSGNSALAQADSLAVDAELPTDGPALRFESFTPEATVADEPAVRRTQGDEAASEDEEAPPPSDPEVLEPGAYPEVQFSRPPTAAVLAERIRAADPTGAARAVQPTTTNGTTFELRFDPPLNAGEIVDVTVDPRGLSEEADSLLTRRVQRIPRDDLGSLAGTAVVEDADDSTATGGSVADSSVIDSPIIVELYRGPASDDETPYRTLEAADDGAFLFEELPEDTYRLRLFIDTQGNGRWDGGTITPYRPAEPIRWVDGTEDVRARWETVIEDPIRIPLPRP